MMWQMLVCPKKMKMNGMIRNVCMDNVVMVASKKINMLKCNGYNLVVVEWKIFAMEL